MSRQVDMKAKGAGYLVGTERLGVRAFDPSHAEAIAGWLSDDAFELFLTSSSLPFPVSPQVFQDYHRAAMGEPGGHDFLEVYHVPSGHHVGHFEVKAINARHRTGTLAHVLLGAKEFRGRGWGKELCELMAKYSFDHRSLVRLGASVHTCNRTAVAAYVMGGFTVEGTVRDVVEFHGKRFSLYQMSLLKSEWKSEV